MYVAHRLDGFGPIAPLVIRVILGILFIYHGFDKFDTGLENVEGAFRSWEVPVAGLAARAVAVFEVVGGVALIVGLATRFAAVLFAIVLIGALLNVKQDLGVLSAEPMPGAELDLAYLAYLAGLAGLVLLVLLGSGWLSIDERTHLEPRARLDQMPTGVTPRS